MWRYLMICLVLGGVSCSGNKSAQEKDADVEKEQVAAEDIQGQWLIENVVESDSSYVRPLEIEPGLNSYIDFRQDNTFGIVTNCNHIGGEYSQKGDSIQLMNISSTEMACDNMDLEEMLIKVLPVVNSIDCINDSITRLNTDKSESYIVLRKSASPVK